MNLSSRNLLYYLLDRGLLEPAAVVDGDVQIAEVSRRHRNFKVLRKRGDGLFVKQALSRDAHTVACLQREGTCCWLAENDASFAALAGRLPRFRAYDPAQHVLSLELLPAAESLTEVHQRLGEFPRHIGEELGRLLGRYHAEVDLRPTDPRFSSLFPGALPAVLQMHRSRPGSHRAFGPAAVWIAETVARDPELGRALDELAHGWRRDALMHGDVKWDNLLVVGDGRPDGESIRIIDWELADAGDPDWDAGAIFQAYLSFWILSMPLDSPASTGRLVEEAQHPLAAMQPALRAYWQSYRRARSIAAVDAETTLARVVRCGAARMVQTAYEIAVTWRRLTPHVPLLLQLSQNLLTRTDHAIRDLLEIRP